MDLEAKRFGSGPRELGGAADLINQYKLCRHHEFFCKRSLPLSISETHYLHNVVGDTSIRKGEGMELDQLVQNNLCTSGHIHPFDLDILHEAFPLRETTPVKLPSAEKGIRTSGKSKSEADKKERKHKKHRDKDRDHKKHRNRHKDNNGNAGMNKNTAHDLKTEQSKEQKDRVIQKRRLAGFEDPPVSGHKKASNLVRHRRLDWNE
ncbi:mediator of RNA polymerase II transcription subunit 19b [Pyrus ussuriensis x Pyrus communis]|uniref:Mediator of RNA polymerase II transcription subunit 19b n=1 Tax=Pyrus ussuriensis x Pyrus communis TaxID=2448454 RepID=A0A5N5FJV7_9ROSA|nr:mediator of RNA polymerase II transcription subunit 19b [Pyrus ussuriensis x Pyrus communis]